MREADLAPEVLRAHVRERAEALSDFVESRAALPHALEGVDLVEQTRDVILANLTGRRAAGHDRRVDAAPHQTLAASAASVGLRPTIARRASLLRRAEILDLERIEQHARVAVQRSAAIGLYVLGITDRDPRWRDASGFVVEWTRRELDPAIRGRSTCRKERELCHDHDILARAGDVAIDVTGHPRHRNVHVRAIGLVPEVHLDTAPLESVQVIAKAHQHLNDTPSHREVSLTFEPIWRLNKGVRVK